MTEYTFAYLDEVITDDEGTREIFELRRTTLGYVSQFPGVPTLEVVAEPLLATGVPSALLLDEPTASLDNTNLETVLTLIEEATQRGAAVVGIFHDARARSRVADSEIDVWRFAQGAS